ncbi:MAG: hypothetical protein KDC07_01845 [Chitinophagaceae bacterium]|nr:hypothetical protein [Chitinophagaceae bacterium]MCB9047522.1 hypothetical protein [Chitinophagales bacterium]
MKKVLYLLFVTVLAISATHVFAQNQGNVYVINTTDCDAYIDVFAVCPDGANGCTTYGSNTMWNIPAQTGYPGLLVYDASYVPTSSNPYWSSSTPPTVGCSNWQWSFANIDYGCKDDIVTQPRPTVGYASDPCDSYYNDRYFDLSTDCIDACGNGYAIRAHWYVNNPNPGEILIVISN